MRRATPTRYSPPISFSQPPPHPPPESRGAHYRSDFPDAGSPKRTFLTINVAPAHAEPAPAPAGRLTFCSSRSSSSRWLRTLAPRATSRPTRSSIPKRADAGRLRRAAKAWSRGWTLRSTRPGWSIRTFLFRVIAKDGDAVGAGGVIAEIEGYARSVLMAERVMLNFIGRLSGIATMTRAFVDMVDPLPVIIASTRKTTPRARLRRGLRALEKRAVKLGGGGAHRYGLDDAILIKDNHIAAAGSVTNAMQLARAAAAHLTAIEVEVDSLAQLQEALEFLPSAVLLDNFKLDDMRQAVKITQGRALLEASGALRCRTCAQSRKPAWT